MPRRASSESAASSSASESSGSEGQAMDDMMMRTASGRQRQQPAEGRRGGKPKPATSQESGEIHGSGPGSDIDDAIPSDPSDGGVGRQGSESGSESDSGSDGGSDGGTAAKAAAGARQPPQQQQEQHALVGVVVVAEGAAPARNAEVKRLLRGGRYFDPDFEDAGLRCFKCGGKGHFARDCTNPAARERSCFLCAGFGHDSRECPNSLCWRCQRPGHMARNCPHVSGRSWDEGEEEVEAAVCMRCGREECPCSGQPDSVRAEGGCTQSYLGSDVSHARCLACGQRGHLCCAAAPDLPPKLSCHNCGEGGHLAAECTRETPAVLRGERAAAARTQYQRQQQQYQQTDWQQQQRYGSGGGGGGGGGRYEAQRYDGGGRYDGGQYDRRYSASRYSEYAAYDQATGSGGGGGGYGGRAAPSPYHGSSGGKLAGRQWDAAGGGGAAAGGRSAHSRLSYDEVDYMDASFVEDAGQQGGRSGARHKRGRR